MKKEIRSIADIIRFDGIKSKGFGTIAKFVMHDRDLSIESKTIYGYFCALCGGGTETYPARSTILSALKLSKNGYYRHYKALIEQGYIEVSKADPKNIKSYNVYTILSNPKKLIEFAEKNKDNAKAKLITDSIDSYGYGILPRTVMIDDRLDIKAKGLYCYLASYAGAGTTVYPEKKNILYHLHISEDTYYRYYNELIDCNYVTPVQRKENGQFSVCDYILNQKPDEKMGAITQEERHKKTKLPNPKKEDISETRIKSEKSTSYENRIKSVPNPKKGDTINEDTKKGDTEKEDTTNISVSINKHINNSEINQPAKNKKNERTIEIKNDDEILRYEEGIRQIIKENNGIPYTFLSDPMLISRTIHTLTGWTDQIKDIQNKDLDNASLDDELFVLANRCLIDMLSCEYNLFKDGTKVSNGYILERINEVIEYVYNDCFGSFYGNLPCDVSINTFLDLFLREYKRVAEYHEIKFPVPHMKTCLYRFFTEFKFKYSVMMHDASRVAFGSNSIYEKRFTSNNA